MDVRTLEPFACAYRESEGFCEEYRVGLGMLREAQSRELYLEKGDFFAGFKGKTSRPDPGACYRFGSGITVNGDVFRAEAEAYPSLAGELEELRAYMAERDTRTLIARARTPLQQMLCDSKVCWGGGDWGGHGNPDYTLLLKGGTQGVRERTLALKREHPEREDFYRGTLMALEALEVLAERYRVRALSLARGCAGEERERLLRIARAFERVPYSSPRDFFEGCQSFWLVFTFDGIDSPGRLDEALIDCWRASEESDRQRCLKELWELFHLTRTWNLCVGGTDGDGNDQTNELSLAILDEARASGYETPNLTLRVHKNTPREAWERAAACIATGNGLPAIYNDGTVVPALKALGIPEMDARRYCMNGCNQIDIYGRSHMGLEDGEVCLAKCLELALNRGKCALTGAQLGPDTGSAAEMTCFEDVFGAYARQVEHAADRAIDMANSAQEIYALRAPNPHRSNWIAGCLEKGRDYKNSGPLYGHGQILTEGLADTVDSLLAIRKIVFERRLCTMAQLADALARDFEGAGELYRALAGCEKFGNDGEESNALYRRVLEHFYGYLLTKRTRRGGIYGGGLSTFSRAAEYGCRIGALPNGKRRASPMLSDSIGAVPGCDRSGPTALLNSVTAFDQRAAKSGHVLNLKFTRASLNTRKGQESLIALIRTYFELGGQQVSVNAVSACELREAREHPEKYASLIVRVGGYSAYFTQLSRELQDNVIARTEYSVQ